MNTQNHENPTISILSGSLLAITSYVMEHGFILDFGLSLLKVCLFGFAGGIFGLIGKRFWIRITSKKN